MSPNTKLHAPSLPLQPFLEASQFAARLGGKVLLEMLGQSNVWKKGPGDWVTAADFQSQKVIRDYLLGQFPDHQFLGEEATNEETCERDFATNPPSISDYCWIVDPLDGTTNFVHQLRSFSVSVALSYRNQVLVGTVFDPMADECFSAAVGEGATLNDLSIQCSQCVSLDQALTVFSMGNQLPPDNPQIQRLLNVLATESTVRRLGSAALNLSYVACGRVDAYWATNLKPWDVAAGWLIARESGAVIEDFADRPLQLDQPRFCCAASGQLFAELKPLLNVGN